MSLANLSNTTSLWASNDTGLTKLQLATIPLYFSFGLVAITGNVILVSALIRSKLIQYGGYLTLAHFAVSDLIFGGLNVFYVPWCIAAQRQFITPRFIPGLLLNFTLYARKVFLVFMALTKLYAVLFPLRARSIMTISWYKKALCMVWVVSVFVTCPLWILRSGYVDYVNYKWTWELDTQQFSSVYWAVTNLFAAFVFMVCYPICFYKLRKANYIWTPEGGRSVNCQSTSRITSMNRERSLLYIFIIDAVIFTLWCVPPYLFELGHIQIPYFGLIKEIGRGILMCYSPIVYWLLNKNIKLAINDLFLKGKEKIVGHKRSWSSAVACHEKDNRHGTMSVHI